MRKLRNFLGAVPLIAWYVFGLSAQLPALVRNVATLVGGAQVDMLVALQTLALALGIAFTLFLILLLIVRDVPRLRSREPVSYLAALVGTMAATTFFYLPTAGSNPYMAALSSLLLLAGFSLSVYALIYLGRSFAVLPDARTLVTDGPYRLVRHPLYLFEEIAITGIMLQYAQPWSLAILVSHLAAQLARMHFEERTLTRAFPDYTAYAARTKRFIPGIY